MPRAAGRRLVLLLCLVALLAGCGGNGTITRTAAQRFDDAVALIAKTLGKTTTEVESGIKGRLPTASVDDLAAQAERTAARTAELEVLAAREAQAAERQRAMLDTVYGATCEWIDFADELASFPPEQRWEAFQPILVRKLVEHNFQTGEADVAALSQDIQDLWAAVSNGNKRPMSDIATDLACFAS